MTGPSRYRAAWRPGSLTTERLDPPGIGKAAPKARDRSRTRPGFPWARPPSRVAPTVLDAIRSDAPCIAGSPRPASARRRLCLVKVGRRLGRPGTQSWCRPPAAWLGIGCDRDYGTVRDDPLEGLGSAAYDRLRCEDCGAGDVEADGHREALFRDARPLALSVGRAANCVYWAPWLIAAWVPTDHRHIYTSRAPCQRGLGCSPGGPPPVWRRVLWRPAGGARVCWVVAGAVRAAAVVLCSDRRCGRGWS